MKNVSLPSLWFRARLKLFSCVSFFYLLERNGVKFLKKHPLILACFCLVFDDKLQHISAIAPIRLPPEYPFNKKSATLSIFERARRSFLKSQIEMLVFAFFFLGFFYLPRQFFELVLGDEYKFVRVGI